MVIVFNYGGGRQTIAMCIMIAKGVLPKPDLVVMADTSFENPMTWEYLKTYTEPLMEKAGLVIEIVPHEYATVKDIYALNGDMILPAWTSDGKLQGFCSNEWKRRVVDRYLRDLGIRGGERWLGLAFDERKRWLRHHNKIDGKWTTVCPLVDKMLNTEACLAVIKANGWPEPQPSSCWFCPHKKNQQWRLLRDKYPEQFADAVRIDEQIRDHNFRERNTKGGKLYLHHSRQPLVSADLTESDENNLPRQCSLGMCFV